ncbi:unnamed protein product [Prunus armeniaca]
MESRFLNVGLEGNGVFKLNIDGSRKGGTGCIGVGSIIRNSLGDWMGGFAVNLGIGQTMDAELWGGYSLT